MAREDPDCDPYDQDDQDDCELLGETYTMTSTAGLNHRITDWLRLGPEIRHVYATGIDPNGSPIDVLFAGGTVEGFLINGRVRFGLELHYGKGLTRLSGTAEPNYWIGLTGTVKGVRPR